MVSELILGRIALWCGFLMLFGIFSDRTSWVRYRFQEGHQHRYRRRDPNVVTSASGVVALIALAIALNTRPRVVIPVLSLLPAIAAFGLSTFVSGLGVWARLQGEIWLYGAWSFAGDQGAEQWIAHPARGTFIFTFLAVLGALATLSLALTWLFGDSEQQRAASEAVSARRAL